MYVRELTNFFTQEATVSSCQPTRLKLWAKSFGQQPVWWVTNIQSILDCNFTPFQYISLIHDWNSLSNLSSLPKKQPATIWDLIQLLQRTLHPIMNSRTKIVYKNTTEKVCFLSREIVQRKLTTFLCKIRPYWAYIDNPISKQNNKKGLKRNLTKKR